MIDVENAVGLVVALTLIGYLMAALLHPDRF